MGEYTQKMMAATGGKPRVQQWDPEDFADWEVSDYIRLLSAVADGLNMETDFVNSLGCIENYTELYLRFNDIKDTFLTADPDVDYGGREPEIFGEVVTLEETYELLLAMGNISSIYRACWGDAQDTIMNATDYVL